MPASPHAKIIIFDLDGTLLDTLEDLAAAVNHALRQYGLPTHELSAVRMMVGNGVRRLMERAVGDAPVHFDDVFACFKTYYVAHCQEKTRLYDGIEPLLRTLREQGHRLAIVSNKLQAGVDALHELYFKDLVDVAIGEREGDPASAQAGGRLRRKPAPDMVNAALQALCAEGESLDDLRRRAIYVGDSDVDILTAQAAAMPCVSVLWGFRDEAFLRQHGATILAATPDDVLRFVQ